MERVIKTSQIGKRRKNLHDGIVDGVPIFIGYIPISITFGMIAIQGGFSLWQAILMSAAVFAGASQFMAVNMLTMGAGSLEVILATFILNLRHFILSLSLMNQWTHIPKKWKVALAFGLTDETFSVFSLKQTHKNPDRFYLIGVIGTAFVSWISGTVIGGLFSNFIPASISLGMSITLYAMFIGLLVPEMQKSWKVSIIALFSILLSLLFNLFLSSGWSIILATLLGSSIGIYLYKDTDPKVHLKGGERING